MALTSLIPEHRVPYRKEGRTEVIVPTLPCGGCQSKGFAVNMDWRRCIFDDYACTLELTANRFFERLEKLGAV
jgi:hypothetical protein